MAIVLSGRSAQADLVFTNVFTGTNFDIQASDPVSLAGTPLEAVTLRAVGKSGALPNAFDGYRIDETGTGITASGLYQVWKYDEMPTPTLTYAQQVTQTLDTHFLVFDTNLATIVLPSEDRDENPDHLYDPLGGFGTFLTGTFSLKSTVVLTPTWDFAYLVVLHGTTVNLDFEIGADQFDSETVSGSFLVPEPSAFALLAAGVLGFLACRKRLIG